MLGMEFCNPCAKFPSIFAPVSISLGNAATIAFHSVDMICPPTLAICGRALIKPCANWEMTCIAASRSIGRLFKIPLAMPERISAATVINVGTYCNISDTA